MAVVIAVQQFFRTFGGTVGLAQLGAVLESRVRRNLRHNAPDLLNQIGKALKSVAVIDEFGGEYQNLIKNAYSDGIKWCFISLLPWLSIGAILSLFLKNIDWKAKELEMGENKEADNNKNDNDLSPPEESSSSNNNHTQQPPPQSSSSPNFARRVLEMSILYQLGRKLWAKKKSSNNDNNNAVV